MTMMMIRRLPLLEEDHPRIALAFWMMMHLHLLWAVQALVTYAAASLAFLQRSFLLVQISIVPVELLRE